MRFVYFDCKKCGGRFKLDIGEHTREKVEEALAKRDTWTCPGQHVELSGPMNYITIDWSSIEIGEAPQTPEEYGLGVIKRHGKENVLMMGDKALAEKLGIPIFQDVVKDADHMGMGEFRDAKYWYSRYDAPTDGVRFYVKSPR